MNNADIMRTMGYSSLVESFDTTNPNFVAAVPQHGQSHANPNLGRQTISVSNSRRQTNPVSDLEVQHPYRRFSVVVFGDMHGAIRSDEGRSQKSGVVNWLSR